MFEKFKKKNKIRFDDEYDRRDKKKDKKNHRKSNNNKRKWIDTDDKER